MKKMLMNKKLWSVVLLVVVLALSMSVMVFAADPAKTALQTFIEDTLVKRLQAIAGAFVVLAAIATAILYMAGAVNPKHKDNGKNALYALIIGVIVLVLSGNIQAYLKSVFEAAS